MIKGKNKLTFFMILYSWLIIFFCLMTPPGLVHGDEHVSMPDHGKYSISGLSTCGSCHSLHPEADTDLDSWGWEDNLGSLRSCEIEMDKTCDLCHQTTPNPSTGPSCTDCHLESPFIRQDCTSCHGNGPFDDSGPNRAGSHPAHALPGVDDSCPICHYGSGYGTDKHYDESLPADVAIMPEYNSKKGVASYDPESMTCSNTRCHGGRTTPAWGDDYSIVENLDCRSCHEYKGDQHISIESIAHHEHINSRQERMANMQCNWCHDTRLLTKNHYREIETPDLSGKANKTIYRSFVYTNINERGCGGSCHSGPSKRWGRV
ncbi:MAG: CxxxxCH/CxxCH domain-containing protein, partial [Deltaproteobacteria bacterium]|nr:CxxxxCH/CxxCH domain-containing protein [Deltaproteobacteria bacterium]